MADLANNVAFEAEEEGDTIERKRVGYRRINVGVGRGIDGSVDACEKEVVAIDVDGVGECANPCKITDVDIVVHGRKSWIHGKDKKKMP